MGNFKSSVAIPASVTVIDQHTIHEKDRESLTAVTIPSSVTTIGDQAFRSCYSLTSVTIPSSVTTIGDQAFYHCRSLTTVTIPSSVTAIGDNAFWNCLRLTFMTIPSSVTSIGHDAFCGCRSLTSVTIPSSVTTIGYQAFYNCLRLTSVTIPSSVTTIGEGTFWNCMRLTSVMIPSSVTTIGDRAFFDCSSLTSVTIPSSVTTIDTCAFYDCRSLTSVTIPSSVTTIGDQAFYGCSSLTTVIVQGSHGITDTLQAAFSSHQVVFVFGALQELKELKAALIEQACRFNQSKLQDGQAPSLEVHAQLHGHPPKVAISVYPDASIYEQLQLELQHAGLVLSVQFGGELIQRGDCFRDWGMEGGATITVIVESIDGLMGEDYAALEPAMQETLEGTLEWYAMQAGASMQNTAMKARSEI